MEAYSLDLRERICVACDDDVETHQEVADRFGVGRWFVQKLLRQRHRSGSIAPKPRGHGPLPGIGRADRQLLRKLVEQKPDATLAELCVSLRQVRPDGGVQVKIWTICRTLQALRLPLKKRRCTPASERRRGCGRCVGILKGGSPKWMSGSWFLWTKAASTPR